MKCAKCGAELKVGCIYCSVCGQEAQIVPDYNLLEDDFLKEVLKEETQPAKAEENKEKQKLPQKKKKTGLVIGGVAVLIGLAVILIVVLNQQKHKNSYNYQLEKAQGCIEDKNYGKAQEYLEQAVKLKEKEADGWLLLADVYLVQDEPDDAVEALRKVLEMQRDNKEAYQKLIKIYAEIEDYDALAELAEQAEDSDILELFADYQVAVPKFKSEPGEYEELITLGITSQPGTKTYYTLDGTDPKKGEEYTEPIALEEGKTTIRMISVNKLGIFSEEAEGVYQIQFQAPAAPKVSPDGGSFNAPQQITIEVPAGCRAYFTWDGSDPTAVSEEYTAPLEIPEGNNILSVILINEHDLGSEITKCNFIYLP